MEKIRKLLEEKYMFEDFTEATEDTINKDLFNILNHLKEEKQISDFKLNSEIFESNKLKISVYVQKNKLENYKSLKFYVHTGV